MIARLVRRATASVWLTSCVLGLGCSAASPHPAAVPGFQWRLLEYGHRRVCVPVAITGSAQQRGLQGVVNPIPMAFSFVAYPGGYRPAFWMKDTPTALIGVWVGARRHRVLGYWHGRPYSHKVHLAPGRLSYVLEFPRRWWSRLPALGSHVAFGRGCPAGNRL